MKRMKKNDKKTKVIIIILAICLLGLEGYFIYSRTNNKLNELQHNLDNLSDEIFSIHNKNVNIMYRLNMNLNEDEFENTKIVYEDENYVCYEVDNTAMPFANGKEYLIYNKKTASYIKNGVTDTTIISHFEKVEDNYYYFVLSSVNGNPHTDIYRIDGTLIESFDAVFSAYDPNSQTFTLEGNSTYTWSPAV